jgi:UTP:GlnB (protein PII) uridylyltransferase
MSPTRAPRRNVRPVVRRFSSDSVEIFWLDKEAAKANVAEAVGRLVEAHPESERVVLFGSLARGDAAPGSDADLLVVLSHSDLPFLERIPRYLPDDAGISSRRAPGVC